MGARRLAIRQPETFALSAKAKKEIGTWVKKYPSDRKRSALIPAMWIAQKDAGGWLPELALRVLGDMLDMAYIRVYEVASALFLLMANCHGSKLNVWALVQMRRWFKFLMKMATIIMKI